MDRRHPDEARDDDEQELDASEDSAAGARTPKARDLTMYSTQSMPVARLRLTIRDGLPGTSMPAWRHVLGRAEIDAVAAYVSRAFFQREGG